MKIVNGTLALTLLVLLASCTSTGSSINAWSNPALSEAQRQQAAERCKADGITAEKEYFEANARGGANSTTPLINNLKVRQRAMALRNETEAACLQAAGFSRQ
jgi:hypothetical protein